jgi:ammonia channel protein AmtB
MVRKKNLLAMMAQSLAADRMRFSAAPRLSLRQELEGLDISRHGKASW